MALTNEDLLAISQLLDVKLKAELEPIKADIDIIKKVLNDHGEKLKRIS